MPKTPKKKYPMFRKMPLLRAVPRRIDSIDHSGLVHRLSIVNAMERILERKYIAEKAAQKKYINSINVQI